jgi:hypothetical protein
VVGTKVLISRSGCSFRCRHLAVVLAV